MDSTRTDMAPANAGKAEKRTPRSIRFYDPEWERIEAFADKRGCGGRGVRPVRRPPPRSRAVPRRRRAAVRATGSRR